MNSDLGIRVLLNDMASSGFNALGVRANGMIGILGSMNTKFSELPKLVQGAGITAGVSAGLFALFATGVKDVVDQAATLEDTMNNIKISVKGAGENMDQLRLTLVTLADNSIFSSVEIGNAFVLMGQRGATATDIINYMGSAAVNFAEATSSQAVPAADLLSSTMQAFGASAKDAGTYSDALTYGFLNGIPSITDLGTALSGVSAEAHLLGIPIQEVISSLDFLVKSGLHASDAGTSLRYMLQSLSAPVPKAAKELSDLGIVLIDKTVPAFQQFQHALDVTAEANKKIPVAFDGTLTSFQAMFTQAQKLGAIHTDKTFYQWAISTGVLKDKLFDAKGNFIGIANAVKLVGDRIDKLPKAEQPIAEGNLFNVRSGKAATLMMKNADSSAGTIKKDTGQASAAGQAAKAAQDKLNSFNNKMKELQTTFLTFEATVGTPLLGPLKAVADAINGVLNGLIVGKSGTAQLGAAFLVSGMAVSGFIMVAAGTIFIFGLFGSFALVIGGIALAIIGLTVVTTFLVMHWSQVQQIFSTVLSTITGAMNGAGASVRGFMDNSNPGLVILKGALGGIAAVIAMLVIPQLVRMAAMAAVQFVTMAAKAVWSFATTAASAVWGFGVMTVNAIIAGAAMLLPFLPFLLIGAAIGAVIAIVILAFQHWGQIAHFIQQVWATASTAVMGFVTSIPGKITGLWAAILGSFTFGGNAVHDWIMGWIAKLLAPFVHFADMLVGHSIIPDMWKMIHAIFIEFPQKILSIVTGFIANLLSFFTNLISMGVSIFQRILPAVALVMLILGTIMTGGLLLLIVLIVTHWTQIVSFTTTAWHNIGSAVSTGVSNIVNFVKKLPSEVMGVITGLGTTMLNAGENLMNMLGQGILNGLSALKNAVGNVAGTIKGWLGFKSPTKEGPLADSDQYMPNMMKMYAQGITSHAHLVHSAIGNVASGMKPNFYPGYSIGGSSGQGNVIHNHFHLDTKEIACAVNDLQTHDLKMNNVAKAFR